MYLSHTRSGKERTSDFNDWCLMETRIADIQDEKEVDEDEAYKIFWEEVREHDTEDYDMILRTYNGNFIEALGNGAFDELRMDYLLSLGYECVEV